MPDNRLIIVDPALRSLTGHHYHFDLSLVEAGEGVGIPCAVLANLALDSEKIVSRLQAIPVFHHNQYECLQPSPGRENDLGQLNDYFTAVFRQTLGGVVNDGDIVVFHAATPAVLLAMGRWISEFLPARRIFVIAILNLGYFIDADSRKPSDLSPFYEGFFDLIRDQDASRLWVWSEHGEAASALMEIAGDGVAIEAVPPIFPKRLETAGKGGVRDGKIRICHQGHSKPERGTHLLFPVVERMIKALGDSVRFDFQVNFEYVDTLWTPELARVMEDHIEAMRDHPQIDLHEGPLTTDAYYDRLGRADLVLLPYTGAYKFASSGLFVEAIAAGKPVVLPADSYLEREAGRMGGGAVAFGAFDQDAIAESALEAVSGLASMQDQAACARNKWWDSESLTSKFKSALSRLS
ncbi:MAG: glycosyltransferase [Rhodospirillales bacterium]|nr:glycosyltransferase [Rhodospirillales bacterium]